jgi:hypothetical protein
MFSPAPLNGRLRIDTGCLACDTLSQSLQSYVDEIRMQDPPEHVDDTLYNLRRGLVNPDPGQRRQGNEITDTPAEPGDLAGDTFHRLQGLSSIKTALVRSHRR